ncbi:hypothetical protein M513_06436 [Trichuris suis]|uniref:Uncharacterized protein n=1 Tax=Trichuris suis TaxID=68888 RepID=A0A085M5U3_9BILA|nr:hypothetical protein M513_06436 [Trichuris suis]
MSEGLKVIILISAQNCLLFFTEDVLFPVNGIIIFFKCDANRDVTLFMLETTGLREPQNDKRELIPPNEDKISPMQRQNCTISRDNSIEISYVSEAVIRESDCCSLQPQSNFLQSLH